MSEKRTFEVLPEKDENPEATGIAIRVRCGKGFRRETRSR